MIPQVAAHRGFSARFPENTRSAFEAACMPGVDAVEFDVQLSRDDIPVVIHDRTLERMGHGPRPVAALDLDELQSLDAGSWLHPAHAAARIPRLEEVLDILQECELWIEIKVYPGDIASDRARRAVSRVEQAVARAKAEDRTRLLCFHRPTLATTGLPRVWNLERPVDHDKLDDLVAVDIDVDQLTPEFSEHVHRAGLDLMCYTVNTESQLQRARRGGADALICDDPSWAVRRCVAR